MNGRKVLRVCFGFLATGLLLDALFPRFHNHQSCEGSVPTNVVQIAGINDARTRKAAACTASRERCKFVIGNHPDGSFENYLNYVHEDFFRGCIIDQGSQIMYYSREGRFLCVEEPFA